MKNNRKLFIYFPLLLVLISLSLLTLPVASYARHNAPEFQSYALESEASCDNVSYRVPPAATEEEGFVTSPNADGPALADLGLDIEEISQINEIDNTFTIEGILDLVWCDPRLEFEGGDEQELFLEAKAEEKLESIWWPDITFVNETDPREMAAQQLRIYENGTVEYKEKFSAVLEANFDVTKFPFDKQVLKIEIQSFAWNEKALKLHIEEKFEGLGQKFQLAEWDIEGRPVYRIETANEVGDRSSFSKFLMTINVTRQFGYYIWKVMLPLVILVLMCFAVFWMEDEDLSSRLGVSFTGVLTVVAYQFIATSSLPKVPYMTLMDMYIAFSFVIMVLSIAQSLFVSNYNKRDQKDKALRLDKMSRLMFPLIYLIGLGGLTAAFMLFNVL